MPKGGARTHSGPPPESDALRRERDSGDWVDLPAEGRPGDPPEWPLSKPTKRELAVWADQWSMPQAFMWERARQYRLVALYVRRSVEAEERGSPVALSTLVKQLADELGLTTGGALRNKWRVVKDETRDKREQQQVGRTSARDRFKVVSDGTG